MQEKSDIIAFMKKSMIGERLKNIPLESSLLEFKKKFIAAIPVIAFFLILFYTVVFFFGVQYALVVSFVTAAFKIRMQKKCTVRSMINLFVVQLLLCILAFFATLNLLLCILLNIIVPFVLIYLQTTQFNQKGYFANAMEFVFLQLRPVGWSGFLPLIEVMIYASFVLIAALVIYSLLHKKIPDYSQARKGLGLIALEFFGIAEGKCNSEIRKDMMSLQTSLHRLAYGSRNFSYVVRGEGKVNYMFALLFQRTAYYLSDFANMNEQNCSTDQKIFEDIAVFLRNAENKINLEDNSCLIEAAKELSHSTERLSEHSAAFFKNFLRLFIIIMESMMEANTTISEWKLPRHAHPLSGFRHRLRLDSFEVRFALRLSLVSTISFVICRLTQNDHAYWLPLNAFILLQPMYEESTYRMKTRLIGTSIGCLLAFFVLPLLSPGIIGHFIFATAMIILMYCCTPGTWVQPIFATGFALTLASMTMDGTAAIELRLLYLVLAVLLVLLVNKFFFPTNANSQFNCNLRELYHMQNSYLTILSISTRRTIDYGVVCEALISFHLIYDEVRKHLKNTKNNGSYKKILDVMWRMTAEIEQMILCTRKENLSSQTRQIIDHFSLDMKRRLREVRRLPDFGESLTEETALHVKTQNNYIDYLMLQYETNLEVLSQLSETVATGLLHE